MKNKKNLKSLVIYFTSYVLNMFRKFIFTSWGPSECVIFFKFDLLNMLHYKLVLLHASILCCRGCSGQHGHAFPLHFQLYYYFFLSFNLRLHLYEFKTYSMVPLYVYFTLLWVPFSQLSIHNTITCVYTYVQFPQFCIFRAGFL